MQPSAAELKVLDSSIGWGAGSRHSRRSWRWRICAMLADAPNLNHERPAEIDVPLVGLILDLRRKAAKTQGRFQVASQL